MSQKEKFELEKLIGQMQKYEAQAEELKKKAEEIKDSIKKVMTDNALEEITTANFVVRFIDVLSSRFDTKRFKDDMGDDAYAYYCKQISSKRFTVSN